MKRWFLLFLALAFACAKEPPPLPEKTRGARLIQVKAYRGEALFDYMDGGAELYYEYGFRRLWVGEYRTDGQSLRAEVFEMEDPAAAYGVLTFEGGGKEVKVADGGFLKEGLLIFRVGRYFCRVSGEGELFPLGEAIARGLQRGGPLPEVLRYLPSGRGRHLYFRGPLALNNFYFLSHEDVLDLRGAEGIAYRTRRGVVIVVRYPTGPPEGIGGLLQGVRREGDVLFGRSRRGWGALKTSDRTLILALDFPSADAAKGALEEVP